jgi:hypothetical protein
VPLLNPWLILAVLLGLIAAAGGGYWKGHRDADKSAEISSLKSAIASRDLVIEEREREAKAAARIAYDANTRAADAIAEKTSLAQQVAAYEAELAAALEAEPAPPPAAPDAPPCRCSFRLSPRDVLRDRAIGARPPAPGPAGSP